MQASMMVVGVVVLVLLAFVLFGGPMVLIDYLRSRRQRAIERQITLTDALDGRLGALVAPVVTKPFLGPWVIRLALPCVPSAAAAEMLSAVDEVFAGAEGKGEPAYRLVLSAKPDSPPGSRHGSRVHSLAAASWG